MPSVVKLTLESNQYERNIKNAQKQLNDFTKSIGLNMKAFSGIALAAGAATTALKVAKDAFFKNEEQLDEWGRTVQSCQSLYSGFLNSLNNGDIGGFLSKMSQIVSAARNAYDAMDELATFNAFNRMNVSNARAGLSEAVADYRMGTGSKENVTKANQALKEELLQRQKLERDAYEKAVRSIAIDRGANPDDVIKLLGGKYVDFKNAKIAWGSEQSFTGQAVKSLFGGATVAGAMSGVNFGTRVGNVPGSDEERLSVFARSLNDTELDKLQAMGEAANNTKREIADLDKQLARVLNGRGGAGGAGGGRGGGDGKGSGSGRTYAADSISAQTNLVSELRRKWMDASEELRSDYLKQLIEAEKKLKEMNDAEGMKRERMQGRLLLKPEDIIMPDTSNLNLALNDTLDKIRDYAKKNPVIIPITTVNDDIKKLTKTAKITADVVGSIGDAFNAIEDPAAKVAGTVMQAIASVALGYAQATVQAAEYGPWAWIAFAATGLATMLSTIASIHSATGYAQGGVIPGSSFSGDQQWARVNAGETILTQAQAGILASRLQSNGLGNLQLSAVIKGETLRLVLNNNGLRTGRGEYVQTNFR